MHWIEPLSSRRSCYSPICSNIQIHWQSWSRKWKKNIITKKYMLGTLLMIALMFSFASKKLNSFELFRYRTGNYFRWKDVPLSAPTNGAMHSSPSSVHCNGEFSSPHHLCAEYAFDCRLVVPVPVPIPRLIFLLPVPFVLHFLIKHLCIRRHHIAVPYPTIRSLNFRSLFLPLASL